MGNRNLHRAKRVKNDEFYTCYEDIENELQHYVEHFKDKVIYLNCDDPRWSNFYKYFVDNFHKFGLKELISSFYIDQSYNLFTINEERERSFWVSYKGELVDGEAPSIQELGINCFKLDGDFRSEESVELLKRVDIVVTNPPFSLFRDYIDLMMKYDKKFIIVGTSNAITYKNVFPLIMSRNILMGLNARIMKFRVPEDTEVNSENAHSKDKNGNSYLPLGNVCWWTNVNHGYIPEPIAMEKIYKGNEDRYPKYDNYNAINVDKVADIPSDYSEAMGVPTSFIGKWNPEQFEILGMASTYDNNGLYNGKLKIKVPIVNGEKLYARIFIRRKTRADSNGDNEQNDIYN